jgi:hypothetical protein
VWPVVPLALKPKRKHFERSLDEAETMTPEVGMNFALELDGVEEWMEDGNRLGNIGMDWKGED